MTYPITKNLDILKRLIAFHISQNNEDYSSAANAIEEIAVYIAERDAAIVRLRTFISGVELMMDSEIDDIQSRFDQETAKAVASRLDVRPIAVLQLPEPNRQIVDSWSEASGYYDNEEKDDYDPDDGIVF